MRAPGTSPFHWRPRFARSSRSKGRRSRSRSCSGTSGKTDSGTSGPSVQAWRRSARKGGSTRWFSIRRGRACRTGRWRGSGRSPPGKSSTSPATRPPSPATSDPCRTGTISPRSRCTTFSPTPTTSRRWPFLHRGTPAFCPASPLHQPQTDFSAESTAGKNPCKAQALSRDIPGGCRYCGWRSVPRPHLLLVVEHPVLWTLHVVVLIALHRPQEEEPGGESERQRHEDQQERRPHGHLPPFRRRSELPTTSSELPAMKAAAAIGWSFPATARGTATRL